MTSPQEHIMAEMARRSMGAPYLFAPDNYRKGRAVREPADLAWACNNTVVLMNMTRGGRTHAQMVRHNLNQFRGWLRAWHAGQPLRGRNEYRHYAIPFGAYRHVVLLSVVAGVDAHAEFHTDVAPEFGDRGIGIAGCATVPEAVLRYLAEHGGSTRDLIELLDFLRQHGEAVPVADVMALVVRRHETAISVAQAHAARIAQPTDRDYRPQLERLTDVLLGMRVRTGGASTYSNAASIAGEPWAGPAGGDVPSIMNDLPWETALSVAAIVVRGAQIIDAVPPGDWGPRWLACNHVAPPYRFVLLVFREGQPSISEHLQSAADPVLKLPGFDDARYPPVVLTVLTGQVMGLSPIFAVQERPGPSATELIIETWRRDAGLVSHPDV